MKVTKKVVSLVLTLMMLVSMISLAVVSTSAAENPYSAAAMALDKEYAYSGNDLGANYTKESTTFKVWAPTATAVSVNLYATGSDKETGAEDLGKYDMTKDMEEEKWTGTWSVKVTGDQKNVYYTYSVTSPSSILTEDSQTRETQDVYSKAVGVDGDRSMVVDLSETDPDNWDEDPHIYVDKQTDVTVWEVHVKDFSYSESSGVSEANRGKYLAFTETGTTLNGKGDISTCIDYLKSLGITHVQINPFYDFGSIQETGESSNFNWGYDPKNYGVPEGSYSSNPYDGNVRIKECKEMIQALHEAGIGVIMDVVYNHTYSRDSCFTYTVPEYYYRMNEDGSYSASSGCGNDTASERAMYRKYMIDMCNYWANEYHIDGFRYDLMGIHDVETMNLIRDELDNIDTRFIMYGEAWSAASAFDPQTCSGTDTMPCGQQNAEYISDRIGLFNDQIRDGIKAGVFDGPTAAGFVSGAMTGSPAVSYGIRAQTYGKGCTWDAKNPTQCVTYASCHDNMTLYDKLVAANHGTGVDWRARFSDCIAQNKLTAAIINSSQGIGFMLAGEEMGRSKDGNENSYNSSATLNMIDWNLLLTNADLVSYYRGMLELRKAFSPFTADIRDTSTDPEVVTDDTYAYHFSTSLVSSSYTIAYTVDNLKEGEWNKVAVMFNGAKTARTIKLSATADPKISADTEWVIIANDKSAGVSKLGEAKGLSFTVPASSAVIAVEKSTFEAADIKSNLSRVVVQSVDETDDSVISTNVILGAIGSGYQVKPDKSIPLKYDYDYCEGNEKGVFGTEDVVVKYYYKNYVPSSFLPDNGDVDEDGNITIMDATSIQKHLAKVVLLNSDQIMSGDYNFNGKTDIMDVTLLQKYLAKMEVSVCTVTTNYYSTDEKGNPKKAAPSVVREARLGAQYKTEPVEISFYRIKELPTNASGKVTENIVVDYHYEYSAEAVTIHVKHDGDATWTPFLWAWEYDDAGTAIDMYESWPGLQMPKADENGWFTTKFNTPGLNNYNIIISNNGAVQTNDYTGLTATEIWVVIDDANATSKGDWLTIYEYNPDTQN